MNIPHNDPGTYILFKSYMIGNYVTYHFVILWPRAFTHHSYAILLVHLCMYTSIHLISPNNAELK